MPRLFQMSSLVTRSKQRADLENSAHIGDSEWKARISEAYGDLHTVVNETGCRYFETTSTITATGAASYLEPTDLLEFVRLDYVDSAGRRRELSRLHPSESNALAGRTGDAYAFTVVDDRIYLYPNPASGSYVLSYVPQAPDLSIFGDSDYVDTCCPAGESFLIWSAALSARSKSESDVSVWLQREQDARQKLMFWAAQRAVWDGRRATAEAVWDGLDEIEGSRWPR